MKLEPQIILTAFGTVLAAEIGCCARTTALALRYGAPASICVGTLLANLLLLLPVFVAGDWLRRALPEEPIRIGCALLFLVMGIQLLLHRH